MDSARPFLTADMEVETCPHPVVAGGRGVPTFFFCDAGWADGIYRHCRINPVSLR